MSPRVTLGFVLALAIMATVVLGLDRFNVGGVNNSSVPTPEPELQVFQFKDDQVTAFTARSGDTTARFEKPAEGDWKIAGVDDPANKSSLTSLLIRMASLRGTLRIADPGTDLKQFGLDTPKMEATAELSDGTKYTLQLGDTTPTQSGTYAKKADSSEVFVVATQLATDLDRLAKNPKEPPTPTPRPTNTITPTPEVTPTPTGTAAP